MGQFKENCLLAISELLKRLGNDEVAIASWSSFWGDMNKEPVPKPSHDALSTAQSPDL